MWGREWYVNISVSAAAVVGGVVGRDEVPVVLVMVLPAVIHTYCAGISVKVDAGGTDWCDTVYEVASVVFSVLRFCLLVVIVALMASLSLVLCLIFIIVVCCL